MHHLVSPCSPCFPCDVSDAIDLKFDIAFGLTLSLEPTFRVPSALELTPEKFHDYLSLASSPPLSLEVATRSSQSHAEEDAGGGEAVPQVDGTPPAPSFAQVSCNSRVVLRRPDCCSLQCAVYRMYLSYCVPL